MDEKRLEFKNHNYFILNSMDDWVRIIDLNGEVIFVNDKMKKETKNLNFLDGLIDNHNFENGRSLTSKILKDTTVFEEVFIDGKYYSIKTSPVLFEGEFEGIVEVYRDITSESKMKIDLFNANRDMLDDIRFVKKIQNSILPKNKTYGKIQLDGRYIPCEDLSGDLFDIIKISEDKYAFYIADVMGHGVRASILTMFVKVTLASVFDRHPKYSPKKALLKIRERFKALNISTSQYFTIWLGVFDFKENQLTYSNAGHNCFPLLYRDKDKEIQRLIVKGRMISNIIEASNYEEIKVDFNKNDSILFFTDGVIEAKNKDKEDYGIDRLENLFKNEKDLDKILDDMNKYSWGEQKDDVALALLEYKE